MKTDVRTKEVEKEDESRDSGIGRAKGVEAAFGFVPSLELTMKSLDEIIRDVVAEAVDANMSRLREEAFDRDFVSSVTITDNGARVTELLNMVEDRMSLRGITVRR